MTNLISASPLAQIATLEFSLLKKIGSGGEGEVYQAHDKQLSADLAIKRMSVAGKTPHEVDTFFDECRKLYLSSHPNVVPVNYGCRDNDYVYISMPYYKNGSLKNLIDSRYLTAREVVRYSLHFLSGVNNIHTKGLLHFDIKPENVLMSNSDTALISDFGFAQFHTHMGFAAVEGTTWQYAPPELFSQPVHNIKYDIYQSGLVMYRMCNGDKHFDQQFNNAYIKKGIANEQNMQDAIKSGRFPDRDFFLPHIPLQLKKIIKRALDIDPNNRYQSTLEMINDLSGITSFNDWRYSIDASGNETWQNGSKIVNVTNNSGSFDIFATKNNRRVTDHIKNGIELSKKPSLVYKCLNNDW